MRMRSITVVLTDIFVYLRIKHEQTEYQSKRDTELDDLQRIIADQKKEITVLNEEIAALKDSNARGPTASIKNLVERLKNQLALKEKQHQVKLSSF